MHYFGGKAKIAIPLSEFLNNQLTSKQPFVDLFCGSCNVVSKINSDRVRVANDLHYELISMWQAVQDGSFQPYRISTEDYTKIKNNRGNYPAWLLGFVGFGLSFSGKYFGGYARNSRGDDYFKNCTNSINKKAANISDVLFSSGSYKDCAVPDKSLLYCDIPYKGTTKYSTGSFDHNEFYVWAESMQRSGHTVLVSEYKHNLPDGWHIVWEHNSKKDIRNAAGEQEATVEILMSPNKVEI